MNIFRILVGLAVVTAAGAEARGSMPKTSDRGYIELKGEPFGQDRKGAKTGPREQSHAHWWGRGKDVIEYDVNLPTAGVWYVWLKVSSEGLWPAVLTWDVNGQQPLISARHEILVQPWAKNHWVNHTRFPDFKIEVHVEKPGKHALRFIRKSGSVKIDKILLTLHHSATMKEGKLDMSGDPGRGRIEFPRGNLNACGARPNWRPPAPKITGQAYHVDPKKGNDKASGTSLAKAWKTFGPVNAKTFQPGDAILLKRGGVWSQGLRPKGNGTKARPITIAAYGKGERPLVNGVDRPGVQLMDQSWWTIQDLQATSNPDYRQCGIYAGVSEEAPRPRGLRILNCVAFDSGSHGIGVGGHAGYDGVLIENCVSFCNLLDGIEAGGSTATSARNIAIRHCTAWSNPGMAGIWINGTQNGLIEDCLAYNNACVNIWVWNAVNITIRRCEAFRGRPQRDAAGFDIDWASQACTMEYCYSHHNEGDAFLLMGSGNVEYLGHSKKSAYNVMRYCVGEGQSVIDMGETFNHCYVYNNVAYAWGKDASAFRVFGWPNDAYNDGGGWPENTVVTNNIFIGADGAGAMYVDDYATGQGNDYDGNLLWRVNSRTPLIRWGGRSSGPEFWTGDGKKGTFPPDSYRTLAEFARDTGLGGESIEADPKLVKPGTGEYGRTPLAGYALRPGSPAIGSGKRVTLPEEWFKARRQFLSDTGAEEWGIPMEPVDDIVDYAGKPVGARPSLGVREP